MNEQIAKTIPIRNAEPTKTPMQDRALRHLADSIYKQLQSEGCHAKDIIGVSTQLLSLVTTELDTKKRPT